ncbi:hypothetical protein EMCRGX_G027217 [Ephydatia muelleri]
MLRFNICTNVPESGGRSCGDGGGGLVELDGRVVWGVKLGLYSYDQVNSKWDRMVDGGGDVGARLAMCGDRLVLVGGWDGSVNSKKVKVFNEGKWSTMPEVIPDMLVGCECSCILSVSEGGMVVMGGLGVGGRDVNDVQVFDSKAKTWHKGPSLPLPVRSMSAVVHGDLVFVMGGWGMKTAVWCAKICDLTSAHACDIQQSIWVRLSDVPYRYSSVCAVDGLLLAIGGGESIIGTNKTSAIYAFHCGDRKWVHVGDMPFQCDMVDTLLSGGELLCVDGVSQQVFKVEVDGGNGRLNIIQRTANHYAKLAMHLLDDRNGDITAGLEEQFQRNPVKIVTAVYMNWISGTGRKPISWRTLIGVLRDIGLISLAEELETALEHSACLRKRMHDQTPKYRPKLNTRAMPTSVNEEEDNKLFDRGSHGTCSKEDKRVPFQIVSPKSSLRVRDIWFCNAGVDYAVDSGVLYRKKEKDRGKREFHRVPRGVEERERILHSCHSSKENLIGPLPKTERGNCYIITLIDYFSKWPEAEPIADKTPKDSGWVSV